MLAVSVPVPAATYYAVYAKVVEMLMDGRDRTRTHEQELLDIIAVSRHLAVMHQTLDNSRPSVRNRTVRDAVQRAEDLTAGDVDAVRELSDLRKRATALTVDSATVLMLAGQLEP